MKTLSFILLPILFFSCGNSTGSTSNEQEVLSALGAGVPECILSYQTKYDQLLPLEVIKKHYNVPAQAKKKYDFSPQAKRHDSDTYEYNWPSDRIQKMKVMEQEIKIPMPNRIALQWIGSNLFMITGKATPLESFKAFYRNASAAEKEAALKKAGEVLKEKGYDEKTTKTATDMAKDLSTDTIIFKDISGVGEAASWRIKDKYLTVLVGKITFQIAADVGTNDEENVALAKKLALEVLNKCK